MSFRGTTEIKAVNVHTYHHLIALGGRVRYHSCENVTDKTLLKKGALDYVYVFLLSIHITLSTPSRYYLSKQGNYKILFTNFFSSSSSWTGSLKSWWWEDIPSVAFVSSIFRNSLLLKRNLPIFEQGSSSVMWWRSKDAFFSKSYRRGLSMISIHAHETTWLTWVLWKRDSKERNLL